MRPRLDEKFETEGDFFVGGMPWSTLRNTLDTVLEDSLQASGHIRDIVDDLKEFVRKDDGAEHELFQLNDVLDHSLRFVRSIIKKSTLDCRIHTADGLPPIKGSPRKIGQVIVNLIINACQALEKPEQSLTIETACSADGNTVFFRITDEGCGIPAADLPCICDPFFTTKRGHGGTGLGLSISAAIIKSHGGTLSFISESERGTTVTLALPAASKDIAHA
jgi:signal transduction histidine kinase